MQIFSINFYFFEISNQTQVQKKVYSTILIPLMFLERLRSGKGACMQEELSRLRLMGRDVR